MANEEIVIQKIYCVHVTTESVLLTLWTTPSMQQVPVREAPQGAVAKRRGLTFQPAPSKDAGTQCGGQAISTSHPHWPWVKEADSQAAWYSRGQEFLSIGTTPGGRSTPGAQAKHRRPRRPLLLLAHRGRLHPAAYAPPLGHERNTCPTPGTTLGFA